jgi:hypothetical protein
MNTRGLINNKEMIRHADQDKELDKTTTTLELVLQ